MEESPAFEKVEDDDLNIATDLALLGIETVALVVIVVLILRRYISFTETDKSVYFSTLIGYFVSFATIFLMPIDVAVTNYLSCKEDYLNATMRGVPPPDYNCVRPWNYVPPYALVIAWNIVYWTTYMATWAYYPILQSYVLSGEFDWKMKLRQSCIENALFYVIALILCIGIFVGLCFWIGGLYDALNVAKVAGNLWGIGVHIALLSYGVIDIPRTFWRAANRHVSAKYCYFMLSKYFDEIDMYRDTLDETLRIIRRYDNELEPDHEKRPYIDRILRSVPLEYHYLKKKKDEEEGYIDDDFLDDELKLDHGDFVNLNAKLKWDIHQYTTAKCLFEETFKESADLEDIVTSRQAGFSAPVQRYFGTQRSGIWGVVKAYKEWLWSHASPVVLRVLAVIFGLMSLALIYSEIVLFRFPQISLFAIIVKFTRANPFLLQILIFGLISYVVMCSYLTIFKIRLFSYYQMIPHQRTDGNSALFSAANLTRLVAPLAINFLHLVDFVNTSFKSPFLNLMTSDPIQDSVFLYLPMVLVVLVIGHVSNIGNHLLTMCKVKSFQFSDDFSDTMIDKGREIMQLERQARTQSSTIIKALAMRSRTQRDTERAARDATKDSVLVVLDEPIPSDDYSEMFDNRRRVTLEEDRSRHIEPPPGELSTPLEPDGISGSATTNSGATGPDPFERFLGWFGVRGLDGSTKITRTNSFMSTSASAGSPGGLTRSMSRRSPYKPGDSPSSNNNNSNNNNGNDNGNYSTGKAKVTDSSTGLLEDTEGVSNRPQRAEIKPPNSDASKPQPSQPQPKPPSQLQPQPQPQPPSQPQPSQPKPTSQPQPQPQPSQQKPSSQPQPQPQPPPQPQQPQPQPSQPQPQSKPKERKSPKAPKGPRMLQQHQEEPEEEQKPQPTKPTENKKGGTTGNTGGAAFMNRSDYQDMF